jgi:hypothetical protein
VLRILTESALYRFAKNLGRVTGSVSVGLHGIMQLSMCTYVGLDGLVVNVLATVPKVRRYNSDQRRWILKAIKICSTTFFGRKVKLSILCRKTVRRVKDPYSIKRDTCRQSSWTLLAKFLPASLLDVSESSGE